MIQITSLTNHKIKYFNSLKERKNILFEKKFLVEGRNIIEEALLLDIVDTLLITDENLYQDVKVEKILVTKEIIKKLSSLSTNIGAIAICRYKPTKIDLNNLKKIIVLDEISNPNNLGTIVRSAKAFHFDAIVLINDSTFPYNARAISSSQGTIFNFPIVQLKDIRLLSSFKPYFFMPKNNSVPLQEIKNIDFDTKYALVFGKESSGIKASTLEIWQGQNVFIEMESIVESLNVANAAAIAMYYFFNLKNL